MSRRGVWCGTVTASAVLLAGGCSLVGQDSPNDDADRFAAALSRGDLSGIPLTTDSGPHAQKWWDHASEGMGASTQRIRVKKLTEQGDGATATLSHVWHLSGSSVTWSYDTPMKMVRGDGGWAVHLVPGVLAPGLSQGEHLTLSAQSAQRADIIGAGGQPLVTERPVVRFGIDKTAVGAARQAGSARALAQLLGIDAAAFAARVKAAGDKAFVEALVLREPDVSPRITSDYPSIPGARAIPDQMPLAPTREFARAVLGTVGPVTAEIVKQSHGQYAVGDVAGLSGLEQRYDARLRGRPGMTVQAVGDRSGKGRTLFRSRPQPGRPLRITLDPALQIEAERDLAQVKPASALVAIRPSTGDILVAADGPGSRGYATATLGRYAPGSTFKVVSSLALLRSGLSTRDSVPCPSTTVVDGKEFKNYSDYPPSYLGRITLKDAVAQSCNTAFISERDRVTPGELSDAAAALGLGEDHDVGFPAFFGSVPTGGSETERAASLIGQGQVLASPMAMAAVAGSVSSGHTVVPRLLQDTHVSASPATPLTSHEAGQLRQLMAAVVQEGSGRVLAALPGPQVLAKTGTAEFGASDPPQTHAWMIASQGDLAVAVFVDVGESGSQTAGPILERFLRAAGSVTAPRGSGSR